MQAALQCAAPTCGGRPQQQRHAALQPCARRQPLKTSAATGGAAAGGAAAPDTAAAAASGLAAAAGPTAAAAAAAAAAAGGSDSEDEYLELPEAVHSMAVPDFNPELVPQLRKHFYTRLGDPLSTSVDRFCWDWWHVPGQYTLLRTPAEAFFPAKLYDQLEDALIAYGERELGCRGISPIWLSCYVSGCHQGLHADAPHGPFAFVLSLTNWEGRRFSGGETLLLQPQVLDYWRRFDSGVGTELPQLTTLIPPRLGQLTVFDGRIPHGVQPVSGTMDPREGRIVLHGWFTTPSPFFSGSLGEEEATPALNACLDALYAALGELPPVVGTVTLRLEVAAEGKVADLRWLTNTLVARPQGVPPGDEPWEAVDATLACIAEHCLAARFPPTAGPTAITLPFVFE